MSDFLAGTFPYTRDGRVARKACTRAVRDSARVFLIALLAWIANLNAQPSSGGAPLPEAEVRARYQNCPNVYYSGPRPGKTHYTKDNWTWAVTPEFARKFCMPAEFISTELTGAEAVAYQMVEDTTEERCGWGGRTENCARATEHRFEIYYENGKIPKVSDVSFFSVARLPSKMLISSSDKEQAIKSQSVRTKPRRGAISPFKGLQFGLQAAAGGRVVWSLGTLYEELYYEEVFEGIDFLAVEGASGFSRDEGWRKSGAAPMVITVRELGGKPVVRHARGAALSDFPVVITLPTRLAERVIAADRERGLDLRRMGQQSADAPRLRAPRRPCSRHVFPDGNDAVARGDRNPVECAAPHRTGPTGALGTNAA